MRNIDRIKRVSGVIHFVLTVSIVFVVLIDVFYWVFLNDLPNSFIEVNTSSGALLNYTISPLIRLVGFGFSLLPVGAVLYALINARTLFSFYKKGEVFSEHHVILFRRLAKSLIIIVITSIIYESAKSVIFSLGNPPGSRVLSVSFSSDDAMTLIMSSIIWVIAWVNDEGRTLSEDSELTI